MENLLKAVNVGGDNDDENIEFVIMENILINRDHVMRPINNFELNELSDSEIKLNFRFKRNGIHRLLQVLGLFN